MSKLTLIEGTNVVPLRSDVSELNLLINEVNANLEPTDRELIMFAYRFLGLGRPIHAQKQLCGLSSGYFDVMIYRDLFSALCSRIELNMIPVAHTFAPVRDDFIAVIKSALTSFEILNFPEKPAFYRFRHDFHRVAGSLLNR